jgi:hypothetical protein
MNDDFNILIQSGNIGFYKSCEVTQLFLISNTDNSITNFFILIVFEELSFNGQEHKFLTTKKKIPVNDEISLGIQQYRLSIEDAKDSFEYLLKNKKWFFDNNDSLILQADKPLAKQFIPSKEGNPINSILKNNFDSGCYLMEFFDEKKNNIEYLLDYKSRNQYDEVCKKIKDIVPMDFSVMRDRIGNVVFQFPVTLMEFNSSSLKDWNGINVSLFWHPLIKEKPDCRIEVFSQFDNNYMGSASIVKNKEKKQVIKIGNLDQLNHIRIRRAKPDLLLATFDGTYIRNINIAGTMNIAESEPRVFYINGELKKLQLTNAPRGGSSKVKSIDYTKHINNRLYQSEKTKLEKSLNFKQYGRGKNQHQEGMEDLKKLIESNGGRGVFLWDPYLSPEDIFKTLYFSNVANVSLKAISRKAFTLNSLGEVAKELSAEEKAKAIKEKFINPLNNNYGLNFEFRWQHSENGWAFHDRFLIFPGENENPSKAYSLGTSINSYGKEHHILQEVSNPQRVIDAFEELWNQLNKPECLVWKSR